MFLLAKLLGAVIKRGTLRVTDAGGTTHVFGEGAPEVSVRLHDRALPLRIVLNPDLYTPEAYMDGTLTLENGATIYDFLYLFSLNRGTFHAQKSAQLRRRVFRALRRWHQANPVGVAASNARHHYDLSTALYRLFLDEGMQYSCAYFRDPARDTLEEAQHNKLIHLTSKLALQPRSYARFLAFMIPRYKEAEGARNASTSAGGRFNANTPRGCSRLCAWLLCCRDDL